MTSPSQRVEQSTEDTESPKVGAAKADRSVNKSRRASIRAALLAAPMVLTLTSNASANGGGYGYTS